MAVKAWKWRLAGVLALATVAPVMLVAPAGASSASRPGGQPSPQAQITAAHGSVAAGQVALFKAATSAGAKSITWTLSGPGVAGRHFFTATCGASTSQMESSFSRAGVIHVVAHVRYASGAVVTATHRLVIRAAKVRPIAAKMAKLATQWLLCLRAATDLAARRVSAGGPPRGCQDQYFDGPVDAIGCLRVLPSYNKIPAPELRLICRVIKCPKSKAAVVPALLPVISTATVRLNGIDFTPATAFVLDQNDGLMVSSDATASMLNKLLRLHSGPLTLAEYSKTLFSLNLTQLLAKYPALATALDLAGFKISGKLTVALAYHESFLNASIRLPGSFTGSGGRPVTSSVKLIASNSRGLVVDRLLIAVPGVDFADTFALDHLAFCYQHHISERFCEKKTGASFGAFEGTNASSWNATAKINILGTLISAVPTRTDPQQGIGFVNGQFNFAGATVDFNPSIPLGDTGVDLSSLAASLALHPTRFHGAIGLTAGDFVSINGHLFLVFASPSEPYTFTGHEVGATGMPTPTVTTTAIAVGGNVGIDLPVVGNTALASGYVLFHPGYLAAGGNINLNILSGALIIAGGINGQFSLDNTTFDIQGNLTVTASIIGVTVSFGAQAVVSSIGVAACGTANFPIIGNQSAGVAYTWGGSVNGFVGTCDLTPYIVVVTVGPGHKVTGPVSLHVRAGLPTEMVQVRGRGGAPEVTISGPGGVHASIGSGHEAISKRFVIFRNTKTNTTYIAILKPKAGTYKLTTNPGSRPIAEVLTAQGRNSTSVVRRFMVHVHN